jgi:hypothetical protein
MVWEMEWGNVWVVVVVEKGNPNWMDGMDKLQLKTWPMGQFFSLLQIYFYSFLVLWAFVHVILGNPETPYNLNFICTREITINVSLFKKLRDIIFLRDNNFLAQKVIVPKKIMSQSFLNSGTLVILCLFATMGPQFYSFLTIRALLIACSFADPYGEINVVHRESPTKIPVWQKIRQSIPLLI